MKSFRKIVLSACLVMAASSVFAKPKAKDPDWFGNVNVVYPESRYIAESASGASGDGARNAAVELLAGFFSSSVQSMAADSKTRKGNDVPPVLSIKAIPESVDLSSEVRLCGVEFSETYFVKKEKKYYCVAYIDREKIWSLYKPQVKAASEEFMATYKLGERNMARNSFLAAKYFSLSRPKADLFAARILIGKLFSPEAEKMHEMEQRKANDLDATIKSVFANSAMTVDAKNDVNSMITAKAKEAFVSCGYTVSGAKTAPFTLSIEIKDNYEKSGNGCSVSPEVTVSVLNKKGDAVYSYSASGEKTSGETRQKALAAALVPVAEKIGSGLKDHFMSSVETK